jgi:hypothetical protein
MSSQEMAGRNISQYCGPQILNDDEISTGTYHRIPATTKNDDNANKHAHDIFTVKDTRTQEERTRDLFAPYRKLSVSCDKNGGNT